MATLKTYNPKKVLAVFGPVILSGFVEGTFINIETEGDGISAIVGCDQEIVRSIDPGSIIKNVTISLLQSSSANEKLSALFDLDSKTGQGVLPLAIKDLSGSSLLISDQAWIAKKPTLKRGKSASDGSCEWLIHAVVPDEAFVVGGND